MYDENQDLNLLIMIFLAKKVLKEILV